MAGRSTHPLAVMAGPIVLLTIVIIGGIGMLIRMELHLSAMEMAQNSALKLRERGLAATAHDVREQISDVLRLHQKSIQNYGVHRVRAFQRLSDGVMHRVAQYMRPELGDNFLGHNHTSDLAHVCVMVQVSPAIHSVRALEPLMLSLLGQDHEELDIFVINVMEGDAVQFEYDVHSMIDRLADDRIHSSPALQVDGRTKLQAEMDRILEMAEAEKLEERVVVAVNSGNEKSNGDSSSRAKAKNKPCDAFMITNADWFYLRGFLGRVMQQFESDPQLDVVETAFVSTARNVPAEIKVPDGENPMKNAVVPQGCVVMQRSWAAKLLQKHPEIFHQMSGEAAAQFMEKPKMQVLKEPLAVFQK